MDHRLVWRERAPYVSRVTPVDLPTDLTQQELMAVREIAHAFLTAERAEDVYQLALERVTPLAGAAFACVYLTDGGSDLMRLAASYNWPERWRPWLGQMVVRVGRGPSGEAASERRAVEVPDVFADDRLEDWQEVARELGFSAIAALPLATREATHGAVTFYFAEAGPFTDARRSMLRTVADQMAATAEKAALIAELRRTNDALLAANEELERRNKALIEARRARDEFLTTISHELRTPLTAMIGYVALLEEGVNGPLTDDQRRDLAQVKRASDRLLVLVDDLLELATLKRGEVLPQRETLDPRALLLEAVDALPTPPAGVSLVTDLPDGELQSVTADRRRVVRVLSALLGNAMKFTDEGEVRASVRVEDHRVVYEISDTGIGIPAAMHEAVFEEFRQVDGTVTRRHGGAGLGLALARRLARLLGGDVTLAESSAAGSRFLFTLPLGGSVPTASAVESVPAAPTGGGATPYTPST